MSIKFEWNDLFSVDNGELDSQHKGMFDLANSIENDLGEEQIKKNIIDLYKYTREHFVTEEQMMRKTKYSKFDEHQRFHKELIVKLDKISTKSFTEESVFSFMTFIYDWLTHHILDQDKDFAHFVQDHG